jgi:hypothetical protein
VKDNPKHNEKTPARQEAEEAAPEAWKIGASTPYDFSARHLTAYGRFASGGDHAGKAGFRATGGGDAHRPATHARDASLPLRVGDGRVVKKPKRSALRVR